MQAGGERQKFALVLRKFMLNMQLESSNKHPFQNRSIDGVQLDDLDSTKFFLNLAYTLRKKENQNGSPSRQLTVHRQSTMLKLHRVPK